MRLNKQLWSITPAAILILALCVWTPTKPEPKQNRSDVAERHIPDQVRKTKPTVRQGLFGDSILEPYGYGSPEDDLKLVAHLIINYRLLAKGLDARHFSSNEAVGDTLRGKGSIPIEAVSAHHRLFDTDGLIVDRWNTPLMFHLVSSEDVNIYSHGPDKILGTDDDLSLETGRVQRGAAAF